MVPSTFYTAVLDAAPFGVAPAVGTYALLSGVPDATQPLAVASLVGALTLSVFVPLSYLFALGSQRSFPLCRHALSTFV